MAGGGTDRLTIVATGASADLTALLSTFQVAVPNLLDGATILHGGTNYSAMPDPRFYVGGDEDTVVIYQGVQQNIGPISLSTPYEDTGIPLDSLSDFARATVQGTISATSLEDARRIVTSISETAGGGR